VTAPDIPPPPSVDDIIGLNRLDDVNATDTGNAKRFVNRFRDVVRYSPENELWYVWNGTHWEPDVLGKAFALTAAVLRDIRDEALAAADEPGEGGLSPRQRLLAHATRTESEGARRRMLSVAPEDPRIVVRADDLDPNDDVITCPNGAVNLLTGELRPNRPADMSTACTLASYAEGAKSGELNRYLDTFVPDPVDQDVLFALLGTALRGGNHCRMLPILLGGTTSGKSQLMAAIARLLRGYATAVNVSVFRGNLDDKPRPDLVKAMFTRIAYATEASKVWELHADQVKRLTGGDSIPYRDLYGKGVEATPRFTPVIVTNAMPRVKGADEAFKRRMIVFTFEHSLPSRDEDPNIKDRFIKDERCLAAILARLVAGARSPLFAHGIKWDLIPTKFVHGTMDSFEELDNIAEFLRWMVELGHLSPANPVETPAVQCAKASDLHAWYTHWVKKHGDKTDRDSQLSLRDFCGQLRTRGWESAKAAGVRWLGWRLVDAAPWL
jgi:putative DNA primase/helicase